MLQLGPELVAGPDRGMHARVEDREARLPVRLGHVHRHVGVAHDLLRVSAGVLGTGDADAGADGDGLLVDHVRHAEVPHQSLGHGAGPAQVGCVIGQDRELVAAQPRDQVALPNESGDPIGDRDQQRVAGGVARACR